MVGYSNFRVWSETQTQMSTQGLAELRQRLPHATIIGNAEYDSALRIRHW
jgi:hypothetical protein